MPLYLNNLRTVRLLKTYPDRSNKNDRTFEKER